MQGFTPTFRVYCDSWCGLIRNHFINVKNHLSDLKWRTLNLLKYPV